MILSVKDGGMTTHLPLGEEVTINGELISEAPVESGRSGDTTLSVRPTVQGKPVHHQEDGVSLSLCCNLGETSLGQGEHRYGIDFIGLT